MRGRLRSFTRRKYTRRERRRLKARADQVIRFSKRDNNLNKVQQKLNLKQPKRPYYRKILRKERRLIRDLSTCSDLLTLDKDTKSNYLLIHKFMAGVYPKWLRWMCEPDDIRILMTLGEAMMHYLNRGKHYGLIERLPRFWNHSLIDILMADHGASCALAPSVCDANCVRKH